MSVKYLNISEKDFRASKCVQKFLPLERALQLLDTKKLWFSNPAKWPDPFERRFVDGIYPDKKKFTWYGRVYCMCVTNVATSEASWKAYSDKDLAVKLEFDRKEYADILERAVLRPGVMDVFVGQMDYKQTKDIEMPLSKITFADSAKLRINSKLFKARLLLLKRKAFKYESEFRTIIVKNKKSAADGITIDIPDILRLIRTVTIGPTVGDEEYAMIRQYLVNRYQFPVYKIMRSNLYRAIKHPIIKI